MVGVPRRLPPNVTRQRTRHGKVLFYYRVGKGPRTPLPAPDAPDFQARYDACLTGRPVPAPSPSATPIVPQTLRWLVVQYQASTSFAALAPATRAARRRLLDGICRDKGHVRLAAISEATIARGRERRAGRPNAANAFVKTLRSLFAWACELRLMPANPAAGVRLVRVATEGHEPWSRENVAQFRAHYPLGTRPRLALEILLYTGLRTVDAVRLGPQHAQSGRHVLPDAAKGGEPFDAPILPTLRAAIEATPSRHLTYLVTEYGQPFSVKGFGQWFARHARRAGIAKTAHGLRKAGATFAADDGASELELMSLFGWRSAKTASIYTRKANRRRLAGEAVQRIERETSTPQTSPAGLGKVAER